jgi:hypothetical protein
MDVSSSDQDWVQWVISDYTTVNQILTIYLKIRRPELKLNFIFKKYTKI